MTTGLSRMSGESCLPGLQGFPIQVIGWSGFIDRTSIVTPNDIQLQFNPGKVPMKYNSKDGTFSFNGSNTFFMGGTQYTIIAIRYCVSKQDGLSNFVSSSAIAEYHIWGIPTPTTIAKADIAVLIVPIVQNPVETSAGIAIMSALSGSSVRIMDTIPQGKGVDVIKYSTCIETNDKTKKTITIAVAYWTNGASVTQKRLVESTRNTPLSPFGIPNIFGFKVLTSFSILDDEKRTKSDRRYESSTLSDMILQPYSTSVPLSVTTSEFKNGFRLIKDFQQKSRNQQENNTGYKCIAIDRSRDIKNGKLLLDPATGKRLEDIIDDAEAEQREGASEDTQYSPKSMWILLCSILGILFGLALLSGLGVFFSSFLFTRKSQYLPPLDVHTKTITNALKSTNLVTT